MIFSSDNMSVFLLVLGTDRSAPSIQAQEEHQQTDTGRQRAKPVATRGENPWPPLGNPYRPPMGSISCPLTTLLPITQNRCNRRGAEGEFREWCCAGLRCH